MKKIIIFLAMSCVPLIIHCKEKITEPKIRLVSASGGLNMRDKPDASGIFVASIPDWVKVESFRGREQRSPSEG